MNVKVFSEGYATYGSEKVGLRVCMEGVEESTGKGVEGEAVDNGFWCFYMKSYL